VEWTAAVSLGTAPNRRAAGIGRSICLIATVCVAEISSSLAATPLAPDAAILAPSDVVAQTEISMDYIGRILTELGLGFSHVVKVNSFYVGDVGEEVLRPNAERRFSYFPPREPTSTGVPVPNLAYGGMLAEIDVVAMT